MDPTRFDRLAKAIARRLTRRQLLGGLGAGGLAGLGEAPSRAQSSGAATCVYAFDATIDVGPSSAIPSSSQFSGDLTITVEPDGAINAAKLVKTDGQTWKVVGQASGRAIHLRFSVAKTGAFVAVGTGRSAIARCPGAMGGPASGPLRRDAGSWSAALKPSGQGAAAATATVPATAAATASVVQSTEAPTAAATETPSAAPTETPSAACDVVCGADTLGLDPAACACRCAAGLTSCQVSAHAAHAKGGVVFQPSVAATPIGYCVDAASDVSNCGACGVACPGIVNDADPTCVAGVCGVACLRGLVTCSPDAVCKTFLSRDNLHCGACGVACGDAAPTCIDSVCVCTADTSADRQNCGACGVVCPAFAPVCAGGQCVAVAKGG